MRKPNLMIGCFKWFLRLSVLVVLLVVGGAVWLMAAPRDITGLSRAIIAQLQPPRAGFEVRAGMVGLSWPSWNQPAQLKLEQVALVSAVHDSVLHIPEGRVSLKLLPLIWGELQIQQLEFSGLDISLERGEAGLAVHNRDGALFWQQTLQPGQASAPPALPAGRLELQFDRLHLRDAPSDTRLTFSALKATLLQPQAHMMRLAANGALSQSHVNMKGSYDLSGHNGKLAFTFSKLNPQLLCQQLKQCEGLPALAMPLAGSLDIAIEDGALAQALLAATGGKGTLTFKPRLPEVVALDSLNAKAQFNGEKSELTLENLALKMRTGTQLSASGVARYDNAKLHLDAQAQAKQMPVSHLYRYWPVGLAPSTRTWATTKIRGGMASQAQVSIRIKPEDLLAQNLPDHFLDARIEVEDSSVDYLPGFEPARDVQATVYFTGTTMRADVKRAFAYSDTLIEKSQLVMTDLNAPGTPMTAALHLQSSPADVVQILRKLPNPALQDAAGTLASARGSLTGQMQLAFNAFSGAADSSKINWDALSYDISAQLQQLRAVRVHPQLLLDALSGQLLANDKAVSAQLNARYAGQDYRLEVDQQAAKPTGFSVRGGGQDIAGSYTKKAGVSALKLRGKRLNLAPFMDDEDKKGGQESTFFDKLPPFHLTLDVDTVSAAKHSPPLRRVKGYVNCPNMCRSAQLQAQIDEKDGSLSVSIAREGARRKLRIASNRLGDLLHVFDAGKNFHGGVLDLQGTYDDSKPGSPLSGRLIITDFFLRDAPILGRILNAGSLVGLLDSLNGDGIRFDKFAADYVFANDVIHLKDGKAAGPAMGVLLEGDINLATDRLDVSGNIAPAHILNSLVGKVPLIGDLLVGGEGESVIAINYAARGQMDDASVSVNPLSALTPGFTRRFFDVFEGQRDTGEVKQPSPPQPAPAAPVVPAQQEETQWHVIE